MKSHVVAALLILVTSSGAAIAGPKTSLGACLPEAAEAAVMVLNRELPGDSPFEVILQKGIPHLTGKYFDKSYALRTIQYDSNSESITFGSRYRYLTIKAVISAESEICEVTQIFLSPHSS